MLNLVTLLLAIGGAMAAIYQHEVAAKSFSCNLTFADKLISGLGLNPPGPDVPGERHCEAAPKPFGVPF